MPTQNNRPPNHSATPGRTVELTAADLPLHCPTKDQMLWNAHPRVFLPIEQNGEATCPYCGTRYVVKDGAGTPGH